jgi:O-antigen polysaccharide polymerase Wzy
MNFEVPIVIVLSLLVLGPFVVAYRSKDKVLFWNPLTMFAAVFAYYFLVGPFIALGFGVTSIYGVDLRDVMWKPWLGGALGLGSIYCGFAIRTKKVHARLEERMTDRMREVLTTCFVVLFGLGVLGFAYDAYISGQSILKMLMPIHGATGVDASEVEREGFAAGNYLLLLIGAFIPAMCVLCASTSRLPILMQLIVVGIPAIQVELFYSSWGYRHRIVSMITSVAATGFLMRGRRPSPVALLLGGCSIVLVAGAIVMTRSYGSGLDIRMLSGVRLSQVFFEGFSDSGTFFTTALVMDAFPTTFHFIGLEPLWIAMTLPVPRRLWPAKPLPEFLDQFQYLTGTGGQAVPVVGEHYMMAGWFGVVVGGIVIGVIYRRFWDFYRANPRNPIVVAMYAVAWALCFPVVNRGYLAQTLMEFFFTLLPLAVIFWFAKKSMMARRIGTPKLVEASP